MHIPNYVRDAYMKYFLVEVDRLPRLYNTC